MTYDIIDLIQLCRKITPTKFSKNGLILLNKVQCNREIERERECMCKCVRENERERVTNTEREGGR